MLLMVLLSVYAATNNFGIGEEYVRYSPDGSLFQVVQVENRDLRIYKVEGETDEDGTFVRWRMATPFRTERIIPIMWASWCPAARRRKSCWLLRRKTARPYRRSRPKRILKNESFRN